MAQQTQLLVVMLAYLGILIAWGVWQGRKVKTTGDYTIAGRRLPGWVAALSERATGESSWALLGLPGAAYALGLAEIWTALGCVAGIITAWWLLAWRIREAADQSSSITFSEFLAVRFGNMAPHIKLVSAAAIVFFFFFYVGAQFLGGGKTLFTMFGLEARWGMLITAAIIVPYTIYGGFRSVVYTDVIQAMIMIVALVAGPITGLIYLSRHPETFAGGMMEALELAGPQYTSLTGGAEGFAAGLVIVGGFSWFFGYLGGQPQLSMRFMAISDRNQAIRARNIGIAWTIVAYIGALMLGWIGLAIFGPDTLHDREMVMPAVMLKIFPPAIAALLITGAVAAMISTADSLLVLSATEFSENILKPALHKRGINISNGLAINRLTTLTLAAVALVVAYTIQSKLIFSIVSYVWAGIGATFSVVVLLSFFWKRYHGLAALVTIVSGLAFTIIWISSGLDTLLTAHLVNFVFTLSVGVLSALLLPKPQ
ncbi:MAG: sodium/proline symporter [Bacteroidetes bacterium]|nr:sodium/proline symporter [Bacteroidota bacterium]